MKLTDYIKAVTQHHNQLKGSPPLNRMSPLERWWEVTKLRFRIWRWGCNFRKALKEVKMLSPDDRGHVLTKWKWDASQCKDQQWRDMLLDKIADFEKGLVNDRMA